MLPFFMPGDYMEAKLMLPVGDTISPQAAESAISAALGKAVHIDFIPSSGNPEDVLYLGLWMLTAERQLEIIVDDPELYPQKLQELRAEMLEILDNLLSRVLVDTEHKVG